MSSEVKHPAETVHWVARSPDGSVLHEGTCTPEQVLTTGQPVLEQAASGIEQLQKLTPFASKFPAMPQDGTQVNAGEIYSLGGTLYRVRQSHKRTADAPSTIPALWLWYRADATIDWVAGEQVYVGTIRTDAGQSYKCIQQHVTQAGWEPHGLSALWELVVVPPDDPTDWGPGQVVAVGDLRMYQGIKYRCRQAHTTQAGWTPPAVPALWEVV